jgi:hypothetical protein
LQKTKPFFPIFTTQFTLNIIPCITVMAPQAQPQLHNASKTLNDFFQHHISPPEIRNAWAHIRIHLLTSSPSSASAPNDPLITAALEKIHERLLLIEKSLSAHQNTAKPSLSYADAVKNPAPVARTLSEEFVPSRLLNEVTVKRSSDAAPLQPSPQVIETINKARAGKPGKVIAARSLKSGDVLVTADTPSTKALLEKNTAWTTAIAGSECVQGHKFMVVAHAVKLSRVDQNEQVKSISNIASQNPSLKSRVDILRVSWCVKMLKRGKTHGPLLLEVGTPMEANILVQESLLHDGELKDCELFIEDCTMTQCYRCYHYRHTAHSCKGSRNCEHCTKEHASNNCPTSKNHATYSCCNCKGKHTAWSRLCPERAARASRAAAAYAARPSLYKIPAKFSSDLSSPRPSPATSPLANCPSNPTYPHPSIWSGT